MRCGHTWALDGVISAIRARYGEELEDALGNRWNDFDMVGDRSEATFLRLLERLPDTACYRSDAHGYMVACL